MSHSIRNQHIVLPAALTLALAVGCTDWNPVAPEPPEEVQKVVRSWPGGCVPNGTVSYQGGVEITEIDFTTGGNLCTVDASSYGVDMADPTGIDTPQGNTQWRAITSSSTTTPPLDLQNLPSPPYAAWGWPGGIYQQFIEIDPPAHEVSFYYSTPVGNAWWNGQLVIGVDSMSVLAGWRQPGTFNFFWYDVETLHANIESWGLMDAWTPVTLTAPWDGIGVVWFNSDVAIDSLVIKRNIPAPTLSCTIVTRGSPTSCTVSGGTIDSVTRWEFMGAVEGDTFTVVDDTLRSTTWAGDAVLSGEVTATVFRNGSSTSETASGDLSVVARPWRWGSSEYANFVSKGGPGCGGFWAIRTGQGNVFGRNDMRGIPCAEQGDLAVLPHPFTNPEAGWQPDTVPLIGPNANLIYVGSVSWHSDRGSAFNPDMDSLAILAPPVPLGSNKQKNDCTGLTQLPDSANWFEFNALCVGWDLYGSPSVNFREGIEQHEEYGTLGTGGPEPNGHQARLEYKAAQPEGDPWLATEGLVHTSYAALNFRVQTKAVDVNERLFDFMALMDTVQVTPNWCGEIWIYDTPSQKYVRFRHPQVGLCP